MMQAIIFQLFLLAIGTYGLPQNKLSYVVSHEVLSSVEEYEMQNDQPPEPPKIYELLVSSNIANRFASTVVTSKVYNFAPVAQQTTFTVVLPDAAYITGFVMQITNRNYTGFVKVKGSAESTYNKAVDNGATAGHIISVRNSNKFIVNLNIGARSQTIFYLFYEQLLARNEHYEHVVNIQAKDPIPKLVIETFINETSPLSFVKTPNLRSGNVLSSQNNNNLDPQATITFINAYATSVVFTPSETKQKEYAELLGGDKDQLGLAGQFVVQYDVERTPGGEVLVKDGYFVHFFAPANLPVMSKYIVFVLDTSGSMMKARIQQLKDAMSSILPNLNDNDTFSLVQFHNKSIVWDLDNSTNNAEVLEQTRLINHQFPKVYKKSDDNIKKAMKVIKSFRAIGGTNMFDSVRVALHLIDLNKQLKAEPMIMFLTDGEPTVGVTNNNKILSEISKLNNHSVPIFSLSLGDWADKEFLKKFSLKNNAFARHIYESGDVVVQLEDFYKDISSPVLKNVTFKYADNIREVSKTNFPTLFQGGELVITGKIDTGTQFQMPVVTAQGKSGSVSINSSVKAAVGDMERVWAYVTVKQMLENSESQKDSKAILKMLDLAIKYSFVTPVTNIVVVEPNKKIPLNVQPADGTKKKDLFKIPPQILQSHSTEPPPVASDENEIKESLPWVTKFETILTDTQLHQSHGTSVNETKSCKKANVKKGLCTLVKNCQILHEKLKNIDTYLDYLCRIDEKHMGICCPISVDDLIE